MTADDGVGEFGYPEVGASRDVEFPAGYDHFRIRRRIGTGREVFVRAGDEVLAYRMQKGSGIFAGADTPVARPGTGITVRLGVGPLAIVAPCRVVYVRDDPDSDIRGFAYGTLQGHPEVGEELFAVTYDSATEGVYAVVAAFSRPGVWYTRLGAPVVRALQRAIALRYIHALSRALRDPMST